MFCFPDVTNTRYLCSTENKNELFSYVIKLTPTTAPPPTTISNRHTINTMTDAELIFAYTSLYILFPLLYIIISTGNITPIMLIWRCIQSGMFSAMKRVQEFITDFTYSLLRVFGQYSFSTYTVVQNGREIYKASSMFYYYPSDVSTVYKIDRAKYNVCKWIDAQCNLYRRQYNGEEPELTETRNDIYDFILHKVDGQPYTRIHRGDFTGRTHTLFCKNYRPFHKSYEFEGVAELTVATTTTADADADADASVSETFMISLKHPDNFFLEKNEILDKKFIQWKLYNEFGRKDIANSIGMPFSNYVIKMYYNDVPAATAADAGPNRVVAFTINHTNSILIGKCYAVKVDSVLRCPIFESNEKQVFDISGVLSSYYSESDSDNESEDRDRDDATAEDDDDDSTAITDISVECDEGEGENSDGTTNPTVIDDPEFEMLEQDS